MAPKVRGCERGLAQGRERSALHRRLGLDAPDSARFKQRPPAPPTLVFPIRLPQPLRAPQLRRRRFSPAEGNGRVVSGKARRTRARTPESAPLRGHWYIPSSHSFEDHEPCSSRDSRATRSRVVWDHARLPGTRDHPRGRRPVPDRPSRCLRAQQSALRFNFLYRCRLDNFHSGSEVEPKMTHRRPKPRNPFRAESKSTLHTLTSPQQVTVPSAPPSAAHGLAPRHRNPSCPRPPARAADRRPSFRTDSRPLLATKVPWSRPALALYLPARHRTGRPGNHDNPESKNISLQILRSFLFGSFTTDCPKSLSWGVKKVKTRARQTCFKAQSGRHGG